MAVDQHPWWKHLPESERPRRMRELRRMRLMAWLSQRRQRLLIAIAIYLLLCAMPLLIGQPHLSLFALLQLLVVPPLGYLVYLLAWHEFHR